MNPQDLAYSKTARTARPPRLLLRGSWQSVNIGDIGHTPGALSLFQRYFPEAEITLWPGSLGHGAREFLMRRYPRLKIAEGSLDAENKPNTPALSRAWEKADLYVSGSGSGFPYHSHAAAFHRLTGKPVGIFGVSTDPISGIGEGLDAEGGTLEEIRAKVAKLPSDHLDGMRYIIDRADFMFCRDTISLEYLKSQGARTPILEFGPDSQLGMHVRDDAKGDAYRRAHRLEEGKFICVIPRTRYTPYYQIHNIRRRPEDEIRDAINDRTTEEDHAKLRETIVSYVRATGNKVMTCPEMTHEIDLAKEALIDLLPADVKKNIVWRDTYWLPDEAAAIFAKAEAVVSLECHSPLIALHNGTPGLYVRQPTDTCKGQMYRDFGADEWFFEVDEISGLQLWSRLEAIHEDPERARAAVKAIMAGIERRQRRMVEVTREAAMASVS